MKLRTYSSLAAFMAHYSALRTALADRAGASNPDDAATLVEMERALGDLSTTDREALRDAPVPSTLSSSAIQRHRARAETHLRRLLAARGLLAG
jgi:hypothetical protein